MIERRTRVFLWALSSVLLAWGIAVPGYRLVVNSRMTAEKVSLFLAATDLDRLPAAERAAALRGLADRINALSLEERHRVRQEAGWREWLAKLTDAEKESLVSATFPTGIKQMMTAFEQLSEAQRQRAIDEALKRLKGTGELKIGDETFMRNAGPPREVGPPVSPQLVEKIREVGLQTFFAESSAQMKVEAAPLLEEIQRQMQTGGWGRHRK